MVVAMSGLLTVEQVAEQLQVNEQTVRRWLRGGELVGISFGGRTGWRISEEGLRMFLFERKLNGLRDYLAALEWRIEAASVNNVTGGDCWICIDRPGFGGPERFDGDSFEEVATKIRRFVAVAGQ
jgi:excisionase family DNA binding protein